MASTDVTNHRGRYSQPVPNSNLDEISDDFPEFELFDESPESEAVPRTYGEGQMILEVYNVNMHQVENQSKHHTQEYDTDNLVIRRGQHFIITITFNRPPTVHDDFQLEFLIGRNPSPNKESQIVIPLGSRAGNALYSWEGKRLGQEGNSLTVEVLPKASAIVGKYRVYVGISTGTGMKRTKRNPETDMYLLFNAWCPHDAVYMANPHERDEYVLNDYGVIYQGSVSYISQRHWNYGQFEKGVLNACIFILDASKMPISDRGKVIKVVRKGSAMINSQDDNGVLVGNWSDEYDMGHPPTSWTGSVRILQEYANTRIPICYAQCWVFAGVFNTFLRCLGIPARVITNFNSAHDNTGNLKTELIFKPNGSPDRRNTRDSIWNYHCWNEVYFKRNDMAERYGGWQCVDSTPQELSSGYYCCGPASVAAIKEGEVCYQYDTGFVFAEVNSDVLLMTRDKYGSLSVFHVDTTHVGKKLLTKAVGNMTAVDVTRNYKHPEGSPADEATMQRAENYGCERDHSVPPTYNITVSIKADSCIVGQDVLVEVTFENKGDMEANITAQLQVSVVFYTGVLDKHFKDEDLQLTLGAKQRRTIVLKVLGHEYFHKLGSSLSLHLALIGKYHDQTLNDMKILTLKTPELDMKVPEYMIRGEPTWIEVSFMNHFHFPLKNVVIYLEGAGISSLKTRLYSEIAPEATISWREEVRPRLKGHRYILAALDCPAIHHVWGFRSVIVSD